MSFPSSLGLLPLLPLTLALLAGAPALADPVITVQATPQGGGLVAHDISVDFRDGLGRSGFIQITLTGNFDSSSSFTLANWPDIQVVDAGQTSSTVYKLQGGTGGGSSVDVVGVGQMVVPKGQTISYTATVSRNGQNFMLVPEPFSTATAGVALAVITLLARRRSGPRW
jgi:hypothetical protein